MDKKSQSNKQEAGHRRRNGPTSISSRGHRRRGSAHGASSPVLDRRAYSQTHGIAWSAPFPSSEAAEMVSEEPAPDQSSVSYRLPSIRDVFPGQFTDTPSPQQDTPGEELTSSYHPLPSQQVPDAESRAPQYTMTSSSGSPPATTHRSIAPHGNADNHGVSRDLPRLLMPISQRTLARARAIRDSVSTVRVTWGLYPFMVDEGGEPEERAGSEAANTSGDRVLCDRCGERRAYRTSSAWVYCSSCRTLWSREE